MDIIRTTVIALGLAISLSACNTTDALTPQVDVGAGTTTQSTPVSKLETEQIASAPLSAPGYNQQVTTYGNTPAQSNEYGAQSTLEAQAQAMAQGGRNPVSSETPGQPTYQQQETRQQARQTEQQADPQNQQDQQQASLPPANARSQSGTIRFLPIIGAPVQAVTPLSRQLGAEARALGLTIKSSSDTSSEQILKGYFSAFASSGTVTVVYVWDVLDNSGNRLHRIQGQETTKGDGADPWSVVPASLMQTIATHSMEQYMNWRDSQRG